jgi:hypothetical protein
MLTSFAMSTKRLSLINYDVLRELCDSCRGEGFHFVPIGAAPEPGVCSQCGAQRKLADVSDSSIYRLVTEDDGEITIVPMIPRPGSGL